MGRRRNGRTHHREPLPGDRQGEVHLGRTGAIRRPSWSESSDGDGLRLPLPRVRLDPHDTPSPGGEDRARMEDAHLREEASGVIVTPAGQQVERALALGCEVAAFNLYTDALQQSVEMVEPEDAEDHACGAWHRDMQTKIGWAEAVAAQEGHTPSIVRIDTYERDE